MQTGFWWKVGFAGQFAGQFAQKKKCFLRLHSGRVCKVFCMKNRLVFGTVCLAILAMITDFRPYCGIVYGASVCWDFSKT